MGRTLPTSYTPIPGGQIATSHAVHEGSAADEYGELDLIENGNYLIGRHTPAVVRCVFRPASDGFALGAGTAYADSNAVWARRPVPDLTAYKITIAAVNTSSPGDDATVKFVVASSGAYVEITIPGDTYPAPGTFTGQVGYDDTETIDNVEMYIKNGPTGACRVWSAHIRPAHLGSLQAGVLTSGAAPMDSITADTNAALSVYHRSEQIANCEAIRKSRTGTVVSWSDDLDRLSTAEITTISATYVLVAIVPFEAMPGEVSLEWSLFGTRSALSTAGSVKLITDHMETKGIAAQEVALNNTWVSPYSSQQHSWNDGGQAALTIMEARSGHVKIYLKGDSTRTAYLMGLNIWFAAVA